MTRSANFSLRYGFRFEDLYDASRLPLIDAAFVEELGGARPDVRDRLLAARADPGSVGRKEESELLIEVGRHLEDFLVRLFGIDAEAGALQARHHELAPLYACKRLFVQRKAMNTYKAEQAATFDVAALRARLEQEIGGELGELAFAKKVAEWQLDESANAERLDVALRYAAWAAHTPEGKALHAKGVLFKSPRKLDFHHLVPVVAERRADVPAWSLDPHHFRRREGFKLTDPGTDLVGGLDQAHYCIWCHEQQRDTCSAGYKDKKPADAPAPFKKTLFGVPMTGCPLDEKISEFHKLRAEGWAVAALAMICIDNPMAAATGHRICNDCMKACIYQKQDPVDIPQSETRVLKDVLELRWGFEIYSLLTRWNPLDIRRPYPKPATGRKVLVVGMGPAGFTLAHHLMNDGHVVVGIDGLKIEPLPAELSGVDVRGRRHAFAPVERIESLIESLDDRVMAGFGGVAEYGITVRWDKNFLKLVRLLVERRSEFAMFGGVRFGGTMTVDSAFASGFDHVALCAGAGRPTVLELPNGLARGVRTASDFLMALQLTGAAKAGSLANMQLRLPVVVVGGGLTAIDTATESLAYYPVQVEKFLRRYETLVAEQGREAVEASWTDEEREIASEFLSHARAIRDERAAAARDARAPRLIEMLREWGGATIAYRKRLVDSPSYTLNHEEVEKALEEGIWFAEGLSPLAVEVDRFGHASALRVVVQTREADGSWQPTAETLLPARSILVAAGTQPNTVLAREDAAHFQLDGRYFQALDEHGAPVKPERSAKPSQPHMLTSIEPDGRAVTFFGDLHPSFFGNVVKAMGSAKLGYPVVSRMLERVAPASTASTRGFFARLNDELRATVHEVVRLTPTIVEVIVRAPTAARQFQPGQFYRLQNFEALAPTVDGTRMQMEGIALTGAWVDDERGLLSTIVLEMGGSSDLCRMLSPGDSVVLMGPTGTPTEIEPDQTVVLVGGGLGNAVLFSIGRAFRNAGSRVLYFAGYKKIADRYKVEEIEAAADVVVWCCDEAPGFVPERAGDKTFVGNIVEAMVAYAQGHLGEQLIRLADADRMVVIGSDRMMAAVARARRGVLAHYVKAEHAAIGSINSPMQCMMKEICAQCLQPHRDPETGKISYVFSCFNQDQPLDHVDWEALNERLRQNSVQEKITARWIDRCLEATPAQASDALPRSVRVAEQGAA